MNRALKVSDAVPYASRIDLSRYDRAPELTCDERRIASRWAAPERPVITKRQLPRLYAPLADVLSHHGIAESERSTTIKIVFVEVGRSKQPYWGWSDDQWLALINRQSTRTGLLLATAYLLSGFKRFYDVERNAHLLVTARVVFGRDVFDRECGRLMTALDRVGFKCSSMRSFMPSVIAAVALEGDDPRLDRFDDALLERVRGLYRGPIGKRIIMLTNGLAALGLVQQPVRFRIYPSRRGEEPGDIHPEWMDWCRRWLQTSTLRERSRQASYNALMRVGVWLGKTRPEVIGPEQWTVEVCAEFVSAVDRLVIGEWSCSSFDYRFVRGVGKPLRPQSKIFVLQVMRRFLADAQNWEWVRLRCNPRHHLATPRGILRHCKVDPRTIDDTIWLKLIWASLNLTQSDLRSERRYSFELVKAIAVVWTHAGLRSNEIVRLRVGCARTLGDDIVDDSGQITRADNVCYLDVPAGKTSEGYTKPVNIVVYNAIEAWTRIRPKQQPRLDRRTGEMVNFLFQVRNLTVDDRIVNNTLIPLLCAKAGVGMEDSRGRITSHRGRASAVTALASVPKGMTLIELAEWCGHRSPQSTMHYIRVKPTRLASAFAQADQLAHMIEVFIDHDAVISGAAQNGAPYKYYDLGDSYCTNPFWTTCPHRMACVGCDFNLPKSSAKGAALAAQSSLTRLLEEVPLSPDERAAVEGDAIKLDRLLARLRDVPALDGKTPAQIEQARPRV
jgi:integrase